MILFILACNIMEVSESEEVATSEEEYVLSSSDKKRIRTTSCTQKQKILTPRLAAVFDKLKVSQRDAVHLLVAVLDAIGLNPSNYILNRSSISEERARLRKNQSEKIIQKFTANDQPLTIHWDTKLLPVVTGKVEDRLAIIASAPGFEQIIDMPAIPCGTGMEISSAVYDALEDKNILTKTEAFVFDTTSSNTGRFKGACTLLERAIGKEILFLGCRHHIFEIVLAAVFTEANVGVSTGPDIAIFKKFKKQWPVINTENYIPGISHPRVIEILGDNVAEVLTFANNKINEAFPRNDYKEFLELVIIFLGGSPPRGIKFTKPGALHYARWMAKAIYCLKIVIFRHQFSDITDLEINGLIEVAGFIVSCYSIFWFDSNKADKAALNDIMFLRKLENYKAINQNIADKAISKVLNHLFYLNEECVGFCLFDDRIDDVTKGKLVDKMTLSIDTTENEDEEIPKKLVIKKENLKTFIFRDNSDILQDLFSKTTKKVFKRFAIPTDFFNKDPHSWNVLEEYVKGKNIVQNLSVVNDSAERGIKLIQEYHGLITKDEEQKQHLMKVSIFFYYLCVKFLFVIVVFFIYYRWYKAIGSSIRKMLIYNLYKKILAYKLFYIIFFYF